jgi:amino acid permease
MKHNDYTEHMDEVPLQYSLVNKNWFHRTFDKLDKDSMRGSILIMLLTALGTGLFTIHHLFDSIGIILAYVAIIVFGLFYYLVTDILICSLKEHEVHSKSINEMIKHIMGPVWGSVYDVFFSCYLFLSLIAQLLSISGAFYNNFADYIFDLLKVTPEHRTFSFFNFNFCLISGVFLFFINVKQSVTQFRYSSLVSLIIILYIVFVCVFQTPFYYAELKSKKLDDYNFINFDLVEFLTSYGLLLFSYNCIANFFGVVSTVHNPSRRRLRKIFIRTFVILGSLFIIFGSVAYMSLGSHNSSDVELFFFRNPIEGKSDRFMLVGRFLMIISLSVASGLTVNPLKIMTHDIFRIQKTTISNFVISVVVTVLVSVIAANFNDIINYISIAGSFSVTLIAFTFPGICGIKTNYPKSKLTRNLLLAWIVGVTLMGFAGSFLAFKNFKSK